MRTVDDKIEAQNKIRSCIFYDKIEDCVCVFVDEFFVFVMGKKKRKENEIRRKRNSELRSWQPPASKPSSGPDSISASNA